MITFLAIASTEMLISPRSMNGFSKIRMLGEATMTGYPTETARRRYAWTYWSHFAISWVDHPGHTILMNPSLKKHATI